MEEEFLVKNEDVPGKYGGYPGSRSVDELLKIGLVILDKWPGPTSHDVSAAVKKVLGLKKAGHAGTLDPSVSGVLLVALENSCKVISALQRLDKEYVGIMHIHKNTDESELKNAASRFVGAVRQKPPVRSAVKRAERTRKVYSFDIIEKDGRNVLFRIRCEAGTYVRVICHQIGQTIGGAHMKELRRTAAGRFSEKDCVRMQDVADAYHAWKEEKSEEIRDYVLPVEAAVEHLGKIIVKDSAVYSIASGSPVYTGGICRISRRVKAGDAVAILTLKGELVALAKAGMSAEDAARKKGLAAKTDRVIIGRDVYPSFKSV